MTINATALFRALHAAIWLVVFLTVYSEISPAFKSFLAGATGHHWVTKSIVSILIFGAVYFLFMRAKEPRDVLKEAYFAAGSIILGGLAIFTFYILHFLGLV